MINNCVWVSGSHGAVPVHKASCGGPHSDTCDLESQSVFCEHSNEVPARCPCIPECYCKVNTCKRFDSIGILPEDCAPEMPFTQPILEQRGSEYGGFDNLRCIAELQATYSQWQRRIHGKILTDAHQHCINMILTKLGRIATGRFQEDNYDDIAGYAELAKKVEIEERAKRVVGAVAGNSK